MRRNTILKRGAVLGGSLTTVLLATCCLAADRAAVLRELRDFSQAGMSRRLGPDYAAYHRGGQAEKFPEVWMVPAKEGPGERQWQLGGPWVKEAGDFSSTQGQVLYVPDKGFFPVDRVTIIEWSNGCFTEAAFAALARWVPAGTRRREVETGPAQRPARHAHRHGPRHGILGQQRVGHFLLGIGGGGRHGHRRGLEPTFRFPPNKVPTAISITNKSEFVLVTVCDVQQHKGQVAVLSPEVNGKKTNFVHEWPDDHAWSLPSVALMTGLKLLGYVDLPGIEFPTGVCAVGDDSGNRMNGRDGNAGVLREYDLAKQADRDVSSRDPTPSTGAGPASPW